MALFGQRLKLHGELYVDGEPVGAHPDANGFISTLARWVVIQKTSRQAFEKWHAKELLRHAVTARSRVFNNVSVGGLVFFYRNYLSPNARKMQAQRSRYLGPGLVIGQQGGNVWVSYAGRCYLRALVRIRGLSPDEVFAAKPVVKDGLAE